MMRALFTAQAVIVAFLMLGLIPMVYQSADWPAVAGILAAAGLIFALLAIAHRPDPDRSRGKMAIL
jgi:protein-S-isoprenylcysteine O-methyltransferase Ste14